MKGPRMFYILIRFRLACVIAFLIVFVNPRNTDCCSIEIDLKHQVLHAFGLAIAEGNSILTRVGMV